MHDSTRRGHLAWIDSMHTTRLHRASPGCPFDTTYHRLPRLPPPDGPRCHHGSDWGNTWAIRDASDLTIAPAFSS